MVAVELLVGRHLRDNRAELSQVLAQRFRRITRRSRASFPSPDRRLPNVECFHRVLIHLSQAMSVGQPRLLDEYVMQLRDALLGRGMDLDELRLALQTTIDVLKDLLSPEHHARARVYLDGGMRLLRVDPTDPSFIQTSADARLYLEALMAGQRRDAAAVVQQCLVRGLTLPQVYLDVFGPVLQEVGRLWRLGRLTLAQEHYASEATRDLMAQIRVGQPARTLRGQVFVGAAVVDEQHDIGLRMACDLMELDGWDVFFLGANTPHSALIEEAVARKALVVGLSATVVVHVDKVAEVIRAMRLDERCRWMRVVVGGRPFNLAPELWQQIGADAMAHDASDTVTQCNRLVSGAN